MRAYSFLRAIAITLLCLLYRVSVRGRENIPAAGSVILCANHLHMLDPVLMMSGTRRPVRFMAKAEVFAWPVIGLLARLVGAFPVKRGDADMRAIKHSLRLLGQGGILGIFPEGTRAKEGEVKAPFQGVTMLAERTQSPIVPVAIVGSYKFRRPLTIVFGQPVNVHSLCRVGEYDRGEATARLMELISALKVNVP